MVSLMLKIRNKVHTFIQYTYALFYKVHSLYCILKQYLIDIFQEYLRENGIPVDDNSSKGKKIKSKNIYILSLIYIVHVLVFDYCHTKFVQMLRDHYMVFVLYVERKNHVYCHFKIISHEIQFF